MIVSPSIRLVSLAQNTAVSLGKLDNIGGFQGAAYLCRSLTGCMPNFTMPLSQNFSEMMLWWLPEVNRAQLQSGIDPNNARGSGRGDNQNSSGAGNSGY
jgi:hypothetical protein